MTTAYPTVPLRAVLTLDRDPVTVDAAQTYDTVGLLSYGKGLFRRPPVPGTQTSYKEFFRLRRDQVVFSRLFAWEGAVAVVTGEFDGYFVSPEFPTFSVDTGAADPEYLGYIARWPRFHEHLAEATRGLGLRRQRVHPEEFLAIEVPLPSVDEQRRVAARVRLLLERQAGLLERIESVSGDAYLRVVPELIAHPIRQAADTETPVRELAEVVNDVVHPGQDPAPATSFVGLQHIESHTGRRTGSSALGEEKGRKFRFAPGDVLYGYLRPYLNKVWTADQHGLCSVDQYVLRPREGVDGELLAHVLRSKVVLDNVRELTHSLQLPRLRSGLLGNIAVPWPTSGSDTLRLSLDALVRNAATLAAVRSRQRATTAALATSMLNVAFAGQL